MKTSGHSFGKLYFTGEKTKCKTCRKLSQGASKIFPLLIGGLFTARNISTRWDYTLVWGTFSSQCSSRNHPLEYKFGRTLKYGRLQLSLFGVLTACKLLKTVNVSISPAKTKYSDQLFSPLLILYRQYIAALIISLCFQARNPWSATVSAFLDS